MSQYPHPPSDLEVISADADLSLLLQCPFRTRALNCLRNAIDSGILKQDCPVTVGHLLALEHFGVATLVEVMCVTEAAAYSGFLLPTFSERTPELGPSPRSHQSADYTNDVWENVVPLLKRLLAVSMEFHRARTLSDALRSDLGKLMTTLSMAPSFDQFPLADLATVRTVPEEFLQALRKFWEVLSPREQLIFEHRFVTPKSRTLEDLGSEVGLTRERVRQIQQLVECKWRHPATAASEARWWLRATAATIRRDVGPVVVSGVMHARIDSAFSGIDAVPRLDRIKEMARRMLRTELAYVCSERECIDAEASAVVVELKKAARSIADDAGLLREHELRGHVPNERWLQHWDVLLRWSGLHRVGDLLALRDTKKARVKAALLSIGRPATRQELGEVSGIEPARIGSHLSNIPSVIRTDRTRWALASWGLSEYEGIAVTISRLLEKAGEPIRISDVVDRLTPDLGVSESSVRSFCNAAMFVIEDGWIRLRGESEPYSYKNHDVTYTPGVFALGEGRVGLLYEVDSDVLRGSGRHLPHAAGAILRVRVNDWLYFSGPGNTTVSVTFPGTSQQGPSLGSTRALAGEAGATRGDMMTVVLDRQDMRVSAIATDLNEYKPGWTLIARLTGIDEHSGLDGLSRALKCSLGEVRATLRNRGDQVVLESMPRHRSSADLDDALAKLEAAVLRTVTL